MRLTLSIKTKTSLALIINMLLWPSSLIAIRIGLESFDAGALALLRYLTASLCMLLVFLKFGSHQKPSLRELGRIFLSGVVGFAIYNIVLNQGEVTVDPGTASFILTQIPVAIVVLAIIFLQERLSYYGWLGIVISIVGVGLIAVGKSATAHSVKMNIGIVYLLIAVLCHATYSIMNKPFLRKFNPIEFTTYAMWGGTLALLFYAPALYHEIFHASWKAILAGIYNGIFPAAIGYLMWSYAMNHLPASKVGSTLYTQPLIAIILSWLVLSEIPVMLSLVGGAMALLGAILVNYSYKTKTTPIPATDELF